MLDMLIKDFVRVRAGIPYSKVSHHHASIFHRLIKTVAVRFRHIRVRNRIIQAYVFQCNTKYVKDMGVDCSRNNCDVRVYQIVGIFDHSKQS